MSSRPAGEPPQKRPRSEQPDSRTVKRTLQFTPIDVALGIDWTAADRVKTLRKTSGTYFILRGECARDLS